jgi:hypothetical protein
LKAALAGDAKTAADATAVANLPATDPTPGTNFSLSNAEAKALGLLAANATGLDGWVGFNSRAEYFFDPAKVGTGAQFDFTAIASHEVTEVMGRYGFGQNGSTGDSPIDLFRYYTASGQHDFAPARGVDNYFSADGGTTRTNSFNVDPAGGDLSDWAGASPDAYNAAPSPRTSLPTTAGDLLLMDVLGYDQIAAVPEAPTAALLGVGIAGLLAWRRHRGGTPPGQLRANSAARLHGADSDHFWRE